MRIETLYENRSLYRDSYRLNGYFFGSGKKTLAVAGQTRGNEYQQLLTCSLLVKALRKAEENDELAEGAEILVIPALNPYSMNIHKRFWPIDNTDINRMFPGYDEGETTQRIAGKIFNIFKDYEYGVQLASNYLDGDFMSHILIMDTGCDYIKYAEGFNLSPVLIRSPRPYDTTTLNYNWQIWDTKAFSLYTTTTEKIDSNSAMAGVEKIMNFLSSIGVLKREEEERKEIRVISNLDLVNIRTPEAGLLEPLVGPGDKVSKGDLLARVLSPVDLEVISLLHTPLSGEVFFRQNGPQIYGHSTVFKILPSPSL